MSSTTELFKCPACGAPLELPAGQKIMKCTYCKSSVIVPGGEGQIAVGSMTGEASSIEKVIELALSGHKLEAIKVFREVTQASLMDAKNVVDTIKRGEAIDITRFLSSEATCKQSMDTLDATVRLQPGKKIAITLTVAVLLLIAGMVGVFVLQKQQRGDITSKFVSSPMSKPITSPVNEPFASPVNKPFADPVLIFGQEGIGPGMLNDPRNVGTDRNGNIFAGDYSDGRINVFDATGKFLRLINIGKETIIQGMAVAPDGTLYISYNGKIHRLDAQGNNMLQSHTGKNDRPSYFESIALGADGSLVAASQSERIVRFGTNGAVNLVIPQAFTSVTGDEELDIHLAVEGLGNIYALGAFNTLVLKYSPKGKYLDQFGGNTQHPAAGVDPGRFQAPDAIAVDGYGRIFISDVWGIQVFDANGQYLQFFKVDGVAFGMAFDLNNNLYVASNKPAIIKFIIKAP